MIDLFEFIEDRAAVTPRMTAVRLAGHPVNYGDLYSSIDRYGGVVQAHGLSRGSALTAALMARLPERLRELAPVAQAEWIGAATRWLDERAIADVGPSLGEAV